MKNGITNLTAAALLLWSSAAQAALLDGVAGDVRVNRGAGFVVAVRATPLSPGDRVKTGRAGGARLVYPDGCVVTVKANSIATVRKKSPCSSEAQLNGKQTQFPDNWCPLDAEDNSACLFAGAIVGGGIGGGLAASSSERKAALFLIPRPASP